MMWVIKMRKIMSIMMIWVKKKIEYFNVTYTRMFFKIPFEFQRE